MVRDPALTGLVGRYLYADYYDARGPLARAQPRRAGRPHHRPHAPVRSSGRSGRTPPGHLYVADQGNGTVSGSTAGPTSGTLTRSAGGRQLRPPHLRHGAPGRHEPPVRRGAGGPDPPGSRRRGPEPRPSWTSRASCSTAASAACCRWRSPPTTRPPGKFYVYFTDARRRHPHRGVPALERPGSRRPGHAPAGADHRALLRVEPQRRAAAVRARRLPLRGHRRRRRGQRRPRQRAEPGHAARQAAADRPRHDGRRRTGPGPLPPGTRHHCRRACGPACPPVSECSGWAARWHTAARARPRTLAVGGTLRIGHRSYRLTSARRAARTGTLRADEGAPHEARPPGAPPGSPERAGTQRSSWACAPATPPETASKLVRHRLRIRR